jgi:hypothetical protein
MKESATGLSPLRMALIVIGVVMIGLWVRHVYRLNPAETPQANASSVAATPENSVIAARPKGVNTPRILADCAPQMRAEPTLVPNIEVNDRYNMAAVTLKVRFLVNGDGFVTRSYVTGFTVMSAADQQAELDFVQHLTFSVADSEECRTRPLEMIANFSESRQSADEWATVIEVHPVYFVDGDRVVQRP